MSQSQNPRWAQTRPCARHLFRHHYMATIHGDEVALDFQPPLPALPGSRLHLLRGTCPVGQVDHTLRQLELERGVTLVPGNTIRPYFDEDENRWYPRADRALFLLPARPAFPTQDGAA